MQGCVWRFAACGVMSAALGAAGCAGPEPAAPEAGAQAGEAPVETALRGAHEAVDNPQETFVDERGLFVEAPIDFPGRRYPAADFPTGPALGERLPDFTLPNQHGEAIDFHADRGGRPAVVVFYRSAVW